MSSLASAILHGADVWDGTLPWVFDLSSSWEQQDIQTLVRYKREGFTFVSITAENFPPTFSGVLECIKRLKAYVEGRSEWLAIGSTLAEIDRGREEGKLVLGFNVQDTVQLDSDVSRIDALYEAGVRHMLLAYNIRNFVADGCAEEADAGLSRFGRRVVREMNRVGMIVDGTHTGRRSSLEAIELCELPPIFSHSGVYALCAHIRNIHDEQIRACAAKGGVIGVVGIGAFLGDPMARTESLFRHIDYIATLVGPEHVALGSDYVKDIAANWKGVLAAKDTMWPDPTGTQLYEGGCVQPEQLGELVEMMHAHGYSADVIKGIVGANLKRVYAAAEAHRNANKGVQVA